MSALDSGKSLLQQILAKLPDHLRATVAPVLDTPDAVDALTLLGDSALARADYSRQMDTIRTTEAKLKEDQAKVLQDFDTYTKWWNDNSGKVAEYDRLKPEYDKLKAGGTPNPDPPPPPAGGLTKDDLDKILAERDASYAGVMALSSQLTSQHFSRFKEVLDIQPLIRLANEKRVPLADAYTLAHGERVKAYEADQEKARIDKLVEERLVEARKSQGQPFPLNAGGPEPSAVDVLGMDATQRAQRYTADSAFDRYQQLTSSGGRGT